MSFIDLHRFLSAAASALLSMDIVRLLIASDAVDGDASDESFRVFNAVDVKMVMFGVQ